MIVISTLRLEILMREQGFSLVWVGCPDDESVLVRLMSTDGRDAFTRVRNKIVSLSDSDTQEPMTRVESDCTTGHVSSV